MTTELYAEGHRDIKTGNILWDPVRGEPVLADFGIAAKAGTKGMSGTRGWGAPEQFDGNTPLDSSVVKPEMKIDKLQN